MELNVQLVKPQTFHAISLLDTTDWQGKLGKLIAFCKTHGHTVTYRYYDDESISFCIGTKCFTLLNNEWLVYCPVFECYATYTDSVFKSNFVKPWSR